MEVQVSADGEPEGDFYKLGGTNIQGTDGIIRWMPQLLWIPGPIGSPPTDAQVVIEGESLRGSRQYPLVWRQPTGEWAVGFDICKAIQAILLEQYHAGLEPAIEMRLPWNYSLLPNWIKGIGRRVRFANAGSRPAEIPFPNTSAPFVVEWLKQLAASCGCPESPVAPPLQWPNGCKAAVCVAHDVDTDWLFHHPAWLDRICRLEESYGLHGAWYCVPKYSVSPTAAKGMQRLMDRGCEIGCHGFNHDAKWPLLEGKSFSFRLQVVREFQVRWKMRGFRSEWLYRTPDFLKAIGSVFQYDSSVPSVSSHLTRRTHNGCGTCFPYRTWEGLLELPLTMPMDEQRHLDGLDVETFWERQVERAADIFEAGGLVMLTLHPQGHQAANDATLTAFGAALDRITRFPGIWVARPDQIAEFVHNHWKSKN